MNDLFIPVLIGTTREQRKSYWAAKLVVEVAKDIDSLKTTLVDPQDFNFPGDGNDPEGKDSKYSELCARADGFFIVSPEYNHSFPGSLKRMLDSEFEHYAHKPVAFAGVSSGRWGGVRAIESLVLTTREMGLVAISLDLHFPNVQDLFDEHGQLLKEGYALQAKSVWEELIWFTRALKQAKQLKGSD